MPVPPLQNSTPRETAVPGLVLAFGIAAWSVEGCFSDED
jgi:hypothetical protein